MDWLRRLAIGFSLTAIAAACLSAFAARQDASDIQAAKSDAAVSVARCTVDAEVAGWRTTTPR